MEKTASQQLSAWFSSLDEAEKKEVLRFVYADIYREVRLDEGLYCGPAPTMIKKGGLYAGPAPAPVGATGRCPTCGR